MTITAVSHRSLLFGSHSIADKSSRAHCITSHQILSPRHSLQVVWIDAAPDPTEVVKIQVFRQRADEDLICNPVGRSRELLLPRLAERFDFDAAISVGVHLSHPNPAAGLGDHLDLGQEPLNERKLVVGHRDSFQSRCSRLVAVVEHCAGLFHFTIAYLRGLLSWAAKTHGPRFSAEVV